MNWSSRITWRCNEKGMNKFLPFSIRIIYLSEPRNIPNSASVCTNPNDIRLGVSSCLAFDDSSGSVREIDSVWWFLDEYGSHWFILGASHCREKEICSNCIYISIVSACLLSSLCHLQREGGRLIETVNGTRNFCCVSFSLAYHPSGPGYATPTFNWRVANCSKQQVAGLLLNNMLSTSRDH